jgi:tetratricopeptide (TPR) repeat protein
MLTGTAAVAALLVGAGVERGRAGDAASELLDPRYVAANGCGTLTKGKNELFKPGLAVLAATPAAATEAEAFPLIDGLGDLHLAITTTAPAAQRYFDQGLRFAFAFNHAAALASFRAAQAADPACAMCRWGEAWVLGPNINAAMEADAVAPAFAAAAQASALADGASALERDLITAMAERYALAADADRAALDLAFADAMVEVAGAHRDRPTVQALAAEALMNTQPWDYWEADGVTPKGRADEIVAHLERALDLDPKHPGAAHLYIHAVEASAEPERAEPYADRLGGAMPAAGHLVHMPSHIYYRVGRYIDSLEANRAAVAADERLFAEVPRGDGIYAYGYYPHNVHFLLVSAQMAGSAEDALAAAEKLERVMSDDAAERWGWVQAIKTAPYTAHAQFAEPEVILALEDPGERFPFVRAFWHYARAIAQLRLDDGAAAADELAAIDAIRAEVDFTALEEQFVPAGTVLTIARSVVDARIRAAAGDVDAAVALLEEAAALQDTVPYMEPPYWYYPVRRTLGAVLLEAGRHEAAADAFEAGLMEAPNSGWSLWGLHQALSRQGDEAGARAVAGLLDKAWIGDRALLESERL